MPTPQERISEFLWDGRDARRVFSLFILTYLHIATPWEPLQFKQYLKLTQSLWLPLLHPHFRKSLSL